jgi:hypothetical protein
MKALRKTTQISEYPLVSRKWNRKLQNKMRAITTFECFRKTINITSRLASTHFVSIHLQHQSPINWWLFLFFLWRCDPTRVTVSSFLRFLDHTERRTTVGSTPLDEWSARRRDLYLTTHNSHNKYPCPWWDSNPRSQQASGHSPKS